MSENNRIDCFYQLEGSSAVYIAGSIAEIKGPRKIVVETESLPGVGSRIEVTFSIGLGELIHIQGEVIGQWDLPLSKDESFGMEVRIDHFFSGQNSFEALLT